MTSENVKASVTPQSNRRHLVAVVQFILIMVVYVISFVPIIAFLNGVTRHRSLWYMYQINHVSNFFIYLAVNKEFRKEAKSLVDAIRKKVQHNSIQPPRVGPQ